MSFISSKTIREADQSAAARKEVPILVGIYLFGGALSALGGVTGIVFGVGRLDSMMILGGIGGLGFSFLLFGLAEFFAQIARIATATEETARLLRQLKP
ncbi:MAG: hypothetical protein PHE83_05785 [Opitutaceae bacterium]|nr:hypothetical protein [Opitutaceae bacterium]